MSSSQLQRGLTRTLLTLLIATGGAAVGWYARGISRPISFWYPDPLDRATLDHDILLHGFRVLLSKSAKRGGVNADGEKFSAEILQQHRKNPRNCFFSFSTETPYGLPMITVDGGKLMPRDTNAWVDLGMTGRFGIKYTGLDSSEYYRIGNLWIAAGETHIISVAGHQPVLIWHRIRYYYSLRTGCWERRRLASGRGTVRSTNSAHGHGNKGK